MRGEGEGMGLFESPASCSIQHVHSRRVPALSLEDQIV